AGPDSQGRQVVSLRREGGAPVLYTYFARPGLQYWALTDRSGNQLAADDAVSGVGLARPSLSWPTRAVSWSALPGTTQEVFTDVVDTGWQYKMQPKMIAQVVHCVSAADTTGELRVMLNGQQLGEVVPVSWTISYLDVGPFDLPGEAMSQHRVSLQCRRTAGTGRVGASMAVRGEQS
ncbi:hypothetical protein, partial [Actinosynnema sp.]|uniref:hypothetical protein n=1 Tax=Actinosynnema sp. TaxID=1872144 RepID=UPI003F82BDAB